MMKIKKIIISRTDSIGDVILTLPVTGVLKKYYPESEIYFLGKSYTKDVVATAKHIDHFINWDEIQKLKYSNQIQKFSEIGADLFIHVFPVKEISQLAKKANIPLRVGTTGRLFHYFTCNKLVPLSRRRSNLHEAQLNLKLIKSIVGKNDFELNQVYKFYGIEKIELLNDDLLKLVSREKFNLILHPKSKGSAREWGLKNFRELVKILPKDKFEIFITGTQEEGEFVKEEIIDKFPFINDLTGKLSLKELISFINEANGLVAASTGPLHIAAALGKYALGVYPPIKPMHPGRWAPVGKNATYIVENKVCSKCKKSMACECMEDIQPEAVKNKLLSFLND